MRTLCGCRKAFAVTVIALLLGGYVGSNGEVLAASLPSDITSHWAEQRLVEALAAGVVKGYPDGLVRPDHPVSRAELVALICRVLGHEDDVDAASRLLPVFPDVSTGHWAAGYFQIAHEIGLVAGDERGRAMPDSPITRAELGAIIVRAASGRAVQPRTAIVPEFSDSADIPDWAEEEIRVAVALGLLRGDEKSRIRPNDGATRAEAVTVLLRFMEMDGSLWQLVGTVASVDPLASSIRIRVSGSEVVVRLDSASHVFRQGKADFLASIKQGEPVRAILRSAGSGVASVIDVGDRHQESR